MVQVHCNDVGTQIQLAYRRQHWDILGLYPFHKSYGQHRKPEVLECGKRWDRLIPQAYTYLLSSILDLSPYHNGYLLLHKLLAQECDKRVGKYFLLSYSSHHSSNLSQIPYHSELL